MRSPSPYIGVKRGFFTATEKTAKIIQQLKQIKEERGLSYQRIVDMVEESGGFTSLSTVRRVFAAGSETQNFRYEDSIKPLVVALLGVNNAPAQGDEISLAQHEADALRTVVSLKEQINMALEADNQRLQADMARQEADYKERLRSAEAESLRKHEHILALTEQNAALTAQGKRKDSVIFWLAFGFIGVLLLVCVVLIFDILNPEIGFIRRQLSSAFTGPGLIAVSVIAVALLIVAVLHFVRKHRRD